MGCAVWFCTVTLLVNACVPELYAVPVEASVTYVPWGPPTITSKFIPGAACDGDDPHERVPVLTVAWQVIAAVKSPPGTAGAVTSRSAHATANVLDQVTA